MSLARPSMGDATHWGSNASRVGMPSEQFAREASNEWTVALANEVAAWESTATLDFYPSRMGSGIGYRKVRTLGVLPTGGDNASVYMIGRCKVPMTPSWSRKAAWTVTVSFVWSEMCLESHMVRWSMHDA